MRERHARTSFQGSQLRAGPAGLCFPSATVLDPRSIAERRDEIAESCRKRRVRADLDGTIAAYEQVTALATEFNEANRARNDHQKAGKKKLSDDEREAFVAEGRRLKGVVAALEKKFGGVYRTS